MFIVPIQPMRGLESLQEARETHSEAVSNGSFKEIFSNALADYREVQQTAEGDSYQLALGNVDNLAQIQINSMKAESMLQTAVQLTTRMVNAYKEIMQMQI